MGVDISVHAIDPALLTDTLAPAVLGEDPASLASFLDRAAHLGGVAARANAWALRVAELDRRIVEAQWKAGPTHAVRTPRRFGALRRLFGGAAYDEYTVPPVTTGVPGFDTELNVWGRPFFVVADTSPEAIDVIEQYLRLGEAETVDLGAVDALARSMVERLNVQRDRLPPDLDPAVRDVLAGVYPLLDNLPAIDTPEADVAAMRRDLLRQIDLFREAWANHDAAIPLALVGLAAGALPGWMGRGYVWPTTILPDLGITADDLFEAPTSLFAPLVEACPALAEQFDDTITDHGRLGGYVPPDRVPQLRQRLDAHADRLLDPHTEAAPDRVTAFRKVLEPVVLSERRGLGLIEAEGVYSGVLGAMN